MASPSPTVSDSPRQPIVLPFSETLRKVDCAVARLEECIVRNSRSNAPYTKRSPPTVRSKLALHAGEPFPNKNFGKGPQKFAQHASTSKPALPIPCVDRKQSRQHLQQICSSKSNGPSVAMSRRSAKVADVPLPHPHKQVISSARDPPEDFLLYGRKKSPPRMSLSSPPSSACSSSVQVMTRRARPNKDMGCSEWPRACPANAGLARPNAASSKPPPRTFFVHAGRANPNRPWCLSSSPSLTTNSSTTSNYIYPSSNSSVPLPTKSPSRFSPLRRQISGKHRESPQMQPLLSKSPEIFSKRIKSSPSPVRRVPWFSQTRISLPSPAPFSPGTRRSTRRFSLTSNRYQESPPRPLPSLITRLPIRRKKVSSPEKGPAASPMRRSHTSKGSTPKTSPVEARTMNRRIFNIASPSKAMPPLPLPPALQALPSSTQHYPLSSQKKASHKRFSSCPRQSLLPLADSATNVNNCNLSPSPTKDRKRPCFQSAGKENCCFSGCGLPAWPCLKRSWSFSHHQPGLENSNITSAGYGKDMSSQSQVYKVDLFVQEPNREQQKLYIG